MTWILHIRHPFKNGHILSLCHTVCHIISFVAEKSKTKRQMTVASKRFLPVGRGIFLHYNIYKKNRHNILCLNRPFPIIHKNKSQMSQKVYKKGLTKPSGYDNIIITSEGSFFLRKKEREGGKKPTKGQRRCRHNESKNHPRMHRVQAKKLRHNQEQEEQPRQT